MSTGFSAFFHLTGSERLKCGAPALTPTLTFSQHSQVGNL